MRKAWGTTLFCDDLRAEVQGTMTLVGLYNGIMNVAAPFPFTLPKLALLVRYLETPTDMAEEDGTLRVFIPGMAAPVIEMPIPFTKMNRAANFNNMPDILDSDIDKHYSMQMPIILSPITFTEQGCVKVRFQIGEDIIKMGALMINSAIPPASHPSTASLLPPLQSPPAAPAS